MPIYLAREFFKPFSTELHLFPYILVNARCCCCCCCFGGGVNEHGLLVKGVSDSVGKANSVFVLTCLFIARILYSVSLRGRAGEVTQGVSNPITTKKPAWVKKGMSEKRFYGMRGGPKEGRSKLRGRPPRSHVSARWMCDKKKNMGTGSSVFCTR